MAMKTSASAVSTGKSAPKLLRKVGVKKASKIGAIGVKTKAAPAPRKLTAKAFWSDKDAAFFQPYADRLKEAGF